VSVAGSNDGSPQTTFGIVGSVDSENVTVVPTGRSCGPSTTVPSARTVSVPVREPSYVTPVGSVATHVTENGVLSGTRPSASPTTSLATAKPPTVLVAVFVTVTATGAPSFSVTVT